MFFRYWQLIGFEGVDVGFDCFLDVCKSGVLRFTLSETAGKAGTLGDPETVFPALDLDLSLTIILFYFAGRM